MHSEPRGRTRLCSFSAEPPPRSLIPLRSVIVLVPRAIASLSTAPPRGGYRRQVRAFHLAGNPARTPKAVLPKNKGGPDLARSDAVSPVATVEHAPAARCYSVVTAETQWSGFAKACSALARPCGPKEKGGLRQATPPEIALVHRLRLSQQKGRTRFTQAQPQVRTQVPPTPVTIHQNREKSKSKRQRICLKTRRDARQPHPPGFSHVVIRFPQFRHSRRRIIRPPQAGRV